MASTRRYLSRRGCYFGMRVCSERYMAIAIRRECRRSPDKACRFPGAACAAAVALKAPPRRAGPALHLNLKVQAAPDGLEALFAKIGVCRSGEGDPFRT